VSDASGNLTATYGNTTATSISVVQTAPNEIHIFDNLNDQGTFLAGGKLTVDVGNTLAGVFISVDLGGFTYSGSVSVKVGNSPPLSGSNVDVENGTIGSDLNITTGTGDDQIGVGLLTAVNVQGNANINAGASGASGDLVFVGSAGLATRVGGNLTVTNANLFTLSGNSGVNPTVGGFLNANSAAEGNGDNWTLDSTSSVLGSVYMTTGSGNDSVTLNGNSGGITGSTVLVNEGNGTNDFTFGSLPAATISGNLTYMGGTGTDTGSLFGTVLGNVAVVQGNGTNALVFGPTSIVMGTSVSITGGTGTDSIDLQGLTAPGARLSAILGAGNDTVRFSAVGVLASAYLDGGYGVNSFFPTGTFTYPVTKKSF